MYVYIARRSHRARVPPQGRAEGGGCTCYWARSCRSEFCLLNDHDDILCAKRAA